MENTDEHNNKYQNAKIYKITDISYTECYIGSTVQTLSSRMSGHNRHYKLFLTRHRNPLSSFYMFEKYGSDFLKIELVEHYPCNTRDELLKREGFWIRQEDTCINKRIAGRTEKEWRDENKCTVQLYSKAYREANHGKLIEHCRQYYKDNRYKLLDNKKQYYENNKDIIRERQSKKKTYVQSAI